MKARHTRGLRQPLGNFLELGRVIPGTQTEMVVEVGLSTIDFKRTCSCKG
jgi:hypothetical protein